MDMTIIYTILCTLGYLFTGICLLIVAGNTSYFQRSGTSLDSGVGLACTIFLWPVMFFVIAIYIISQDL